MTDNWLAFLIAIPFAIISVIIFFTIFYYINKNLEEKEKKKEFENWIINGDK